MHLTENRHGPGIEQTVIAIVTDHPDTTHAVRWAAEEALVRGHRLGMVGVLTPRAGRAQDPTGDDDETAAVSRLLAARSIVNDVARGHGRDDLRLDLSTERGPLVPTLVEVSSRAAIMVIGTLGVDPRHPGHIGGARGGLVAAARCPVVRVVRPVRRLDSRTGPVVAAVSENHDDDVLRIAAEEATLRGVPLVVATGDTSHRMVDDVLRDHTQRTSAPVVVTRRHTADALARQVIRSSRSAQLVVVRASDAEAGLRLWHRATPFDGESFLHAVGCPIMMMPVRSRAVGMRLRHALHV
ncbi:MAG: hypothetical protein INR72_09990 [Williamsia herbipolensis]|nr:hypothetical protein [Williamsia herbipolensis]